MTTLEIAELVEQYGAGIDAELQLLEQLKEIAVHQRDATTNGDINRFNEVADRRDDLMRSLVTLEDGLKTVRAQLGETSDATSSIPGYAELAARHRDASQVITHILAIDRQSMAALADAELARRSAVTSLERGETTLAAYRRVLAPPVEHARLVDRMG